MGLASSGRSADGPPFLSERKQNSKFFIRGFCVLEVRFDPSVSETSKNNCRRRSGDPITPRKQKGVHCLGSSPSALSEASVTTHALPKKAFIYSDNYHVKKIMNIDYQYPSLFQGHQISPTRMQMSYDSGTFEWPAPMRISHQALQCS